MSHDKFEARLNKINASVQPKGRVSGGGSGSWKNGQGATGIEPRVDRPMHRGADAPVPEPGATGWPALKQRLADLFKR